MLRFSKKRVVDAPYCSGNHIPILGEINVNIDTPEGTFSEKLLVYEKDIKK